MGAGYGILLQSVLLRWPGFEALTEALRWFLFITSGVYHTYVTLPWYVAQWAWYQPMVAPLEYTRHALDVGYPVGDLSLVYSATVAVALVFLGMGMRRWVRQSAQP
jgi:ABC-type polysaccharide/polyol phosphate export permease